MNESHASGRLRSCIGEDDLEPASEQLEILQPLLCSPVRHKVAATSDLAGWPRLEQGMQLVSKSFRSFPSYMSEQRLVFAVHNLAVQKRFVWQRKGSSQKIRG